MWYVANDDELDFLASFNIIHQMAKKLNVFSKSFLIVNLRHA